MDRVLTWLKRPYSDDMDVIHWVLFILLVIIVTTAWRHVLTFIEE